MDNLKKEDKIMHHNFYKTIGTFYGIIYYCLSQKHHKDILYPILFACEEELKHYPKEILKKALFIHLERYREQPLTFKKYEKILINFIENISFNEEYSFREIENEKKSTRTTAENGFCATHAI